MRRLDHLNIVQLKYFFFSSGDKVKWNWLHTFKFKIRLFYLCVFTMILAKRWSLLESCIRIHTGNGLSCGTSLYQTEANHSAALCQSITIDFVSCSSRLCCLISHDEKCLRLDRYVHHRYQHTSSTVTEHEPLVLFTLKDCYRTHVFYWTYI
jgi:hypothetical protein